MGLNPVDDDFFPAKSGQLVLHDGQQLSEDPFDIDNSFRYETNTFNVLEMVRHIDLSEIETDSRAGDPVRFRTGGDDGSPIMSWWQRYDMGYRSRLVVQISRKIDNPGSPNGPLTYGDDELYGWQPWQNVYVLDVPSNSLRQEYQWVRQQGEPRIR